MAEAPSVRSPEGRTRQEGMVKVRGSTRRGTGRMEAREVTMERERWNSSSCSDRVVRGPKRTYARFAQVEFQGEETVPGTFRAGNLNSRGGEDRLRHQGQVGRQQNPAGRQEEKSSSPPHPGSQGPGMSLQLGNGEGIRPPSRGGKSQGGKGMEARMLGNPDSTVPSRTPHHTDVLGRT